MMRPAPTSRHGLRHLRRPRQPARGWAALLPGICIVLGVLMAGGTGCGVVGDPIAPEDIGIEAKVRAQRQAEALRATPEGQPVTPREEIETILPPLQPAGTQ